MTDHEGFLLAVSALGLGFAAFISLILALRPADSGWDVREFMGLRMALEHNLGQMLAGLVPVAMSHARVDDGTIWLITARLLACFLVAEVGWNAVRLISLKRKLPAAKAKPRHPILIVTTFLLPSLVLGYLLVWTPATWRIEDLVLGVFVWLFIPPTIQMAIFLHHATAEVVGRP